MRIVHVVEPFASGIAAFVKSLVENLQEDLHIVVHGEREYILKSTEVKQYFPKENVRFIRWKSAQREISLRKDTAALMELYTILKRLKKKFSIDAVHLHSSKSGFLGRLACKMAGIDTVVYTPNGAPFLGGNTRFSNYMYKQLEKIGSSFGGQVVCCSPSELQAYQALGIDAVNINNGVSVNTTQSNRAEALKNDLQKTETEQEEVQSEVRYQDPQIFAPTGKGKFRIATSGRIVVQKNATLFNTIANYFAEFSDFEFIWVGDGEDRYLLTSPNIRITGWMEDSKDSMALIASSHVYLSTSHFEGMPFAVLEAMALKRPVLLSDCVGNRDSVDQGLNGDLFRSPEEAILKLLQYYNNRDMLEVMGQYSEEHCAREFDVNDTYASYRDLYKSGTPTLVNNHFSQTL